MIPRYQSKDFAALWSDEFKYQTWTKVELAYLEAYLAQNASEAQVDLALIRDRCQKIKWSDFKNRVEKYDQEVKHDLIAYLHALEDELGHHGRLIHLGLTSSDIVDTAFALLLKEAGQKLSLGLSEVIETLWQKACANQGVACLGRTHGQSAEPMTFGLKLLSHCLELFRGKKRLTDAISGISIGKLSGAVGLYAHTNPEIEAAALKSLGLAAETVATQVVARDRHAAFFSSLAIIAGSIERLALEIRLLMHGQVAEAFEPFSGRQKGSSAMPHKKNPVLSENLCGLMRLVRSNSVAAMENQALWHERDISHSSVERVIAPDSTSLIDFALTRLQSVIKDLVIDQDRMAQNIAAAGDKMYSQGVMLALVKKGMMRQEAYELVQRASLKGDKSKSFYDNLQALGIKEHLSEPEVQKIFAHETINEFEPVLFKRARQEIDG